MRNLWTTDRIPVVETDPTQLGLVFQNPIGNAIKFRQPDVWPQIRISAEWTNPMWTFMVKDNGIGLMWCPK
jgi:light-regulated signal transduction histidine kinase (bacteriophytochrome)